MYVFEEKRKNNLFILFVIIILVVLFTIIAYTLFLDSRKYEYNRDVAGTKLYYKKSEIVGVENVLENSLESVVGISKIKNTGTTVFLEKGSENLNLGSGIIVSSNGYVLTNQHIAGEKYSLCYVTLKNGATDTGTVLWSSEDLDLAIIKINIQELPTAYLGNSDEVKIGSNVYAIGNPVGFELQRTVTSGIVSGTNRIIKIEDGEEYSYLEGLIQTDAIINNGNSGGPLINEVGEVIGITTLKIDDVNGIGFAVPINIVKPILEKLQNSGEFEETYLGISGYDKDVIPYLSGNVSFESGIYVECVDPLGPLKDSKIVKGDVLTEIDGVRLSSVNQLKEYLFSKAPGDSVVLIFKRGKRDLMVKVKLAKR